MAPRRGCGEADSATAAKRRVGGKATTEGLQKGLPYHQAEELANEWAYPPDMPKGEKGAAPELPTAYDVHTGGTVSIPGPVAEALGANRPEPRAIGGADHRITDAQAANIGVGSPREKTKRNVAAIRLLKEIEKAERPATRSGNRLRIVCSSKCWQVPLSTFSALSTFQAYETSDTVYLFDLKMFITKWFGAYTANPTSAFRRAEFEAAYRASKRRHQHRIQ